jgi:hypothetical protein
VTRCLLIVIACCALAVGACGDDDDSEDSSDTAPAPDADAAVETTSGDTAGSAPTNDETADPAQSPETGEPPTTVTTEPPAPVQDVEADRASAEAALPTIDEMPAGWRTDGEDEDTEWEFQGACEYLGDSDAWVLSQAEGDDELPFAEANFSRDNDDIGFEIGVFPSADLAAEFVAATRDDRFIACLQERTEGAAADAGDDVEVTGVEIGQLSVPDVADERVAFEVVVSVRQGDFEADVYLDAVYYRSGRAVGAVVTSTAFSPLFERDELTELAADKLVATFAG